MILPRIFGPEIVRYNRHSAVLNIQATYRVLLSVGVKVAVKAMQKGKITDYESFQNEINILMTLVS